MNPATQAGLCLNVPMFDVVANSDADEKDTLASRLTERTANRYAADFNRIMRENGGTWTASAVGCRRTGFSVGPAGLKQKPTPQFVT